MWKDKLGPLEQQEVEPGLISLSTSASPCSVCLFFYKEYAKNQSQEHKENYYYLNTSAVAVSKLGHLKITSQIMADCTK